MKEERSSLTDTGTGIAQLIVTMFIVVRRCTIYTPPRSQEFSDFEGLHVCIL